MFLVILRYGSQIAATNIHHHHHHHRVQARPGYKPGPSIIRVGSNSNHKICTADELHYVLLANSDWSLALRYLPSPKADPIQALNLSVFPIGALLAATHPLSSRPPYVLSWWNLLISSSGMLHPELFEKLVLNGFGSVPSKVLVQLTTVFQECGLCNRGRTLFYKDHMNKSNVPILALAADRDLICPPEAGYETVKLIPDYLITYKVFGEPSGPHYAHYNLVGGQMATDNVYPCILKFLKQHDRA